MKMISMNEFQNAYSTLLQEVITLRESFVITQQEQPVVRISPYSPEPNDNPLKNSIVFEKDIIAPIDEVWEGLHLQPTAHHKLETEMIAALKQDAEDHVYQAEIMAWDSMVGDGIDAKK